MSECIDITGCGTPTMGTGHYPAPVPIGVWGYPNALPFANTRCTVLVPQPSTLAI